ISAASDAYEGKIVDFTKDSIIIQMVGDSRKIDNFVALMKEYDILEICRTGIVSLQRGSTTIRRVTNL
ncbi:MAG: acetolactate synthase small subunit, partial [Candidatus Limivicinus sp.]